MPYQIHKQDRHSFVTQLADLLALIPEEDTKSLFQEAEELLRWREFGHKGIVRNADKNDPYWFEHRLIKSANEYLVAGNPFKAWLECLSEHNHGHSGFTGQIHRVYKRPSNEAEKAISEEIRKMIVGVLEALLDSDPLSKDLGMFGEGRMILVAIENCISLLGANVAEEYIKRFESIIIQCEKSGEKIDDLFRMKRFVEQRLK